MKNKEVRKSEFTGLAAGVWLISTEVGGVEVEKHLPAYRLSGGRTQGHQRKRGVSPQPAFREIGPQNLLV
jgi:hypothetical protein